MITPRRQLPSAMTCGVSATTTTVLPLTSNPSTSPLSTWKASTTLQRSWSAGMVSPDVVHGHTMSQEQFSKYVPSSRHVIRDSLLGNEHRVLPRSYPVNGPPRVTAVVLQSRPAVAADLPALVELQRGWEAHWFGAAESDEDEVRDSFDRVEPLERCSRLLFDGDRLVAAAWWWQPDETSLHVSPAADLPAVYDDVLPWFVDSGASRVEALNRDELLRGALVRHGWTHLLSQFELSRDATPLPPPRWPQAVTTTTLDDHADAVHRLIYVDAAWADVAGHRERELEEWRSIFVAGHDPEQQVLAWHDGRLVGVALGKTFSDGTGWVSQLAVASDHRGRGLGTALLAEAFARRLAGGAVRLGLGVSAANPDALRMYLGLGLEIDREWMAYRRLG